MSFRAGTCYLTVLALLTEFLRQTYAVILYSHQDVGSPAADVEHYILGMGVFFNVGKRFLSYFPESFFNRLWKSFDIGMEVVGDTQPRALGHLTRIARSEEHTSELQSHLNLVCRLLLEKKNTHTHIYNTSYTNSDTSICVTL